MPCISLFRLSGADRAGVAADFHQLVELCEATRSAAQRRLRDAYGSVDRGALEARSRCLAERMGATVSRVSETLRLTILYEDGGDGWIVASIPEVPGAHSQGHTRQEARENVIDALQTMLTPDEMLREPATEREDRRRSSSPPSREAPCA